jgi:EAL domain-containing protein (putative c-di-GMP-specific phosphodiesterase class I)
VARTHPTIIVAKLHRFEEVRQTLPTELHAEYVLRIIDRLNAAAPATKIYLGPGHAIAWCLDEKDQGLVKDHLEGLRALFGSPLQVGEQQVDVGITFGVDISPSRDVVRRLANAVTAAERTTETYSPIQIAEAKSEDELIWNISLQARIDAALTQNEIFLVYQPKISIETGEMVGMEALVRWRDPVRGLIPPDSFISQCEETGRIGHLTRHVLGEACLAGALLEREGRQLSVAVNISATLLHDTAIVAMVREVLAQTDFDPRLLTLEITETYRISDMGTAGASLHELAALGITISMDDFGVGAASLEALLHLPFAELKIDRVFIDQLGQKPRALAIVRSVLELGRQLRIKVVAEGVEDAATLELLRQAGCPLAQGFGICRPVTLAEAVDFRDRSEKLKCA